MCTGAARRYVAAAAQAGSAQGSQSMAISDSSCGANELKFCTQPEEETYV